MESVHDLLDASVEIPEMDIQDIDVRGSQLFKAGIDTNMHGLDIVAGIMNLLLDSLVSLNIIYAIL
jgi:hypothetical protein